MYARQNVYMYVCLSVQICCSSVCFIVCVYENACMHECADMLFHCINGYKSNACIHDISAYTHIYMHISAYTHCMNGQECMYI